MLKKTIWSLLFLLPITAFSAEKEFCESYVAESYQQNSQNQRLACGFSGKRWNNDKKGQMAWCLSTSKAIANKETEAREKGIEDCEKEARKIEDELEKQAYALVHAACDNNVKELKRLIEEEGVSVYRDPFYNNDPPAIACAIANEGIEAVKYLLEQGQNPNRTSNGGASSLIGISNPELLKLLIKNGADLNSSGELGDDFGIPLYSAVHYNDIESATLYLEHGAADPNYFIHEPLLSRSIKNNNDELTRLLLRHGANPNLMTGRKGCKDIQSEEEAQDLPIVLAEGNTKIVEALIHSGAKTLVACIAEQ